jgi:predicted  nucleic acid-binding Zn-ribbon protein
LHPDLALIIGLWDVDKATDDAHDHARRLKHAVDAAKVRIEGTARSLEALKAERAALRTEEAELQRSLDRYVMRRDRTAELLKGGSALDYLMVEKQLDQCTEKVDELEVQVMGCMERQEEMSARESALDVDTEVAASDHQAARGLWTEEGQLLRTELADLSESRIQKWKGFPKDLCTHYKDLRRRSGPVVVAIIDGNCSGCQITINPQAAVDLMSGRRVHTCRGCRRYLRLPVDTEEAEA